MSVRKIVIANGCYRDESHVFLISFDENEQPLDIIPIFETKVGRHTFASVERVLPNIGGCFLKLDEFNTNGFLEGKKINPEFFVEKTSQNKDIVSGDSFFVEITQDSKGNKPLSCKMISQDASSSSDFLDFYFKNYIKESIDDIDIITDMVSIAERLQNSRLYNDESISLWALYDFTKHINNSLSHKAYLDNGSNVTFDYTEALTVIDINTGKNDGRLDFFQINLLAAKKISYEIRNRNISGIIVIDFLKNNDKMLEQKIIDELKACCKDDPCMVQIHHFTALGLLELTRSRAVAPICEIF